MISTCVRHASLPPSFAPHLLHCHPSYNICIIQLFRLELLLYYGRATDTNYMSSSITCIYEYIVHTHTYLYKRRLVPNRVMMNLLVIIPRKWR